MSQNSGATSQAGKPLNVGDQCTVLGQILTVAATTPTKNAVVTVQLSGSGNTVSVQAQDIGASTQTL